MSTCSFCEAAYPGAQDQYLMEHSHDPRMGDLARAFAKVFQGTDKPTDEQVGWFCQDADAVIEDHPDATSWMITDHVDQPRDPDDPDSSWSQVDQEFTLNGVQYIVQPSEWEPSHPVKRSTFLGWLAEADA